QQRPRTMGSEKTDHFMEMALPHLDSAYNIAFWLMRDKSSAEDVVQEALLRALTYFQSFDGRNARAWLLQIVRNTAYATLRQRHP
ncbi:sigma factor, partial [Escherichia coli]|uniref:sigma factor n=1 Tax=Escherichia coli TaxID=562 RepID=UPI003CE4773D